MLLLNLHDFQTFTSFVGAVMTHVGVHVRASELFGCLAQNIVLWKHKRPFDSYVRLWQVSANRSVMLKLAL